jgi:hypothetical protein
MLGYPCEFDDELVDGLQAIAEAAEAPELVIVKPINAADMNDKIFFICFIPILDDLPSYYYMFIMHLNIVNVFLIFTT